MQTCTYAKAGMAYQPFSKLAILNIDRRFVLAVRFAITFTDQSCYPICGLGCLGQCHTVRENAVVTRNQLMLLSLRGD